VQGSLRDTPLDALVELVTGQPEFAGGTISLRTALGSGAVYLTADAIVGAEYDGEHGVPALMRLVAEDADFRVTTDPPPSEKHTIAHLRTADFIRHRRMAFRAWTWIQQRVGGAGLAAIPLLAPDPPTGPLAARHVRVLGAMSPGGSIMDVVAASGLDELTACQAICEMQDLGVLAPRFTTQVDDAARLRAVVVRERLGALRFAVHLPESAEERAVLDAVRIPRTLDEVRAHTAYATDVLLRAVRDLLHRGILEVVTGETALRGVLRGHAL
jgi:hypothetical protein